MEDGRDLPQILKDYDSAVKKADELEQALEEQTENFERINGELY